MLHVSLHFHCNRVKKASDSLLLFISVKEKELRMNILGFVRCAVESALFSHIAQDESKECGFAVKTLSGTIKHLVSKRVCSQKNLTSVSGSAVQGFLVLICLFMHHCHFMIQCRNLI